VRSIGTKAIILDATQEEIDALPRYSRRSDEDIARELQDRLEEATVDCSNLQIAVSNGVVELEGTVRDVSCRRHAEAITRSVTGVIDVQNAISTDQSLQAQVIAALLSDPLTDVAVIEVMNERGIITLKGRVDSVEISEAAERIAGEQPGVMQVVNALDIRPDEHTSWLRGRNPVDPLTWIRMMK